MSFPEQLRGVLSDLGQAAAEVSCPLEGYREFVSVYATPRQHVINSEERFPYLKGAAILYRLIRFRVKSDLITQDADVGPNDLIGLQEIFLPSEDAVEYVMDIWDVAIAELLSPREVEIPV